MGTELTIGRVAERTGVPAGTLRIWEARFGFPEPDRAPSGHRRYGEEDVAAVERVVRERESGLSLSAAISRARAGAAERDLSIYAGLRRRRPDLLPAILPKDVLDPVSRALEDECLARAGRGVVVGSFQEEAFFRASERRWQELARTAALALVFADFAAPSSKGRGPVEVPVDRSHPMSREWAVLCHAPGYSACLAAWELPSQEPASRAARRFEAILTIDPEVVLTGVWVACAIAADAAPGVDRLVAAEVGDDFGTAAPDALGVFSSLTARILSYVGARDSRRRTATTGLGG